MAQIGVFTGATLALPDDKGRLALPAMLRNAIATDGKSKQIFITTHEIAPCLVASGTERLAGIAARIDRAEEIAAQRGDAFDRFTLERKLFGPGETVPVDGSGRFILSDMLCEIAEFSGQLFFFGAGQYFEIWDCVRLLEQGDAAYAAAQQALRAALRLRAKREPAA